VTFQGRVVVMSSNVKLISITPNAEKTLMYCARVSNPANQESDSIGLLNYCLKEGHFSIFEMANAVFEINTTRTIARQILRHRSFSFQEFSQRYASVESLGMDMIAQHARSQDSKNRQNSVDDLSDEDKSRFFNSQQQVWHLAVTEYKKALERGVAKECARALLPEGLTPSRLYMNGTIRSWIHFLQLRAGNGTQLETQEVAKAIAEVLRKELPNIPF